MGEGGYEPFERGRAEVGVRTIEALDRARSRLFPVEVWYPVGERGCPLVVFSHHSGGDRRAASYLCTHLASHGYAVAALTHSEVTAPQPPLRADATASERTARIDAVIAGRVPDVRFLLDHLLDSEWAPQLDADRIGLVGHSFGGWTVLAALEVEPRVGSVVALGPGGSSRPRPGILPLALTFDWGRDVPVMYLAAEDDVPIPVEGVIELFDRTRGPKRMFILRRADHQHFLDDVEGTHEAVRAMSLPGDAAWIPAAMRPMSELASGEQAHLFTRGLTLAHLDATLRGSGAAELWLAGDVVGDLAARGVETISRV